MRVWPRVVRDGERVEVERLRGREEEDLLPSLDLREKVADGVVVARCAPVGVKRARL